MLNIHEIGDAKAHVQATALTNTVKPKHFHRSLFCELTKFVEAAHVVVPFAEPHQEPARSSCKRGRKINRISNAAQSYINFPFSPYFKHTALDI